MKLGSLQQFQFKIMEQIIIQTDLAKDTLEGLSSPQKYLSSKYFYDDKGSKIFQDIMRMPESFQMAIHAGSVSITVAEEFWSCPDAARREYFLEMAVEHGVTKSVARMWVDDYKKEKRSSEGASEPGRGVGPVYEDTPIYRGCDICKDPVKYEELVDLRICPGCNGSIVAALKDA